VPNCAEGGVLGVLPGIIGAMQAAEAIKLICGIGVPLSGRLLHFDALTMRTHEVSFERDAACPACGDDARPRLLADYDEFCGTASKDLHDSMIDDDMDMTPTELKALLDAGTAPWLLDVREPWEYSTARIAGATLIPLGELASRVAEVPRDADVVVYCHHGMRSARGVAMLRHAGWERVRNLTGGIEQWSVEADPKTPRY
jgi:adenylyltransferase/sulfurtransferase